MQNSQFKCIFCKEWVNISAYEEHMMFCKCQGDLDISTPKSYIEYRDRMEAVAMLEERE